MSTRAGMIRRRLAAQRGQDAVAQLKARLREPLRARLEASAKVRGVSLNTELVDRLEQSFAREETHLGGLRWRIWRALWRQPFSVVVSAEHMRVDIPNCG